MSDLRTAAQQALEALESMFTLHADDARPKRCGDAISALRAALEQPEQEPVAWRYLYSDGFWRFSNGERVNGCDPVEAQPLYTHPPRREWQELSNGEIYTAYIAATNQTLRPQDERLALAFARAIEAALKERNA